MTTPSQRGEGCSGPALVVPLATLILEGILPRARRTRARNLSQEEGSGRSTLRSLVTEANTAPVTYFRCGGRTDSTVIPGACAPRPPGRANLAL